MELQPSKTEVMSCCHCQESVGNTRVTREFLKSILFQGGFYLSLIPMKARVVLKNAKKTENQKADDAKPKCLSFPLAERVAQFIDFVLDVSNKLLQAVPDFSGRSAEVQQEKLCAFIDCKNEFDTSASMIAREWVFGLKEQKEHVVKQYGKGFPTFGVWQGKDNESIIEAIYQKFNI